MPPPLSPESLDPAQVLLLLDDAEARRSLTSWLGTRNVDEMLSFVERSAAQQAGADGGRRRVVLLHGIMGGQLVDRRGLVDDMLWFDLPQLLYRGGLERLRLTEDGLNDASRGTHIEPTRPIRIVYDLLSWHLAGVGGFRVHPFAYDWRKSIDIAADRLDGHLESLAAGDTTARFSIVAHSMGGLVTLRYATRHPQAAARRLEQVVLMGSPLAGCFEPFELWSGIHPTAKRVERVAPGHGDTIRQVFATFPGMAELCADPQRYDSEALLQGGAWPDLPPLGRLLERGRAWRSAFRFPDFLRERMDIVLSASFDTCVGLRRGPDGVTRTFARGDGSVPVSSAWCEGARGHYVVPTHHALLPVDHNVRSGVVALLANDGTFAGGMRRVTRLDDLLAGPILQGPTSPNVDANGLLGLPAAPGAVPQAPFLPSQGPGPEGRVRPEHERPEDTHAVDTFAGRAERGEMCNGDGMWLLGCLGARPGDPTAGGRPLDPVPDPRGPRGFRAPRRPIEGRAPREPRPL